MKKLELELHKTATEKCMQREITNLALDTKNNVYRAYCTVSIDHEASVKTYLYVPSEGLSESQACRILLSLMVVMYMGGDIEQETEKLINEAKKPNKKSGKKQTEKPVKESKPEADESGEEESEEPVKKPKTSKPEKKEAKTEKTKKGAKTIAYDRNKNEHKKELAKVLHDEFPGWDKDKELGKKAKEVSTSLQGVAIFDNKGEVLPTFVENVIELMGGDEESNDDIDL